MLKLVFNLIICSALINFANTAAMPKMPGYWPLESYIVRYIASINSHRVVVSVVTNTVGEEIQESESRGFSRMTAEILSVILVTTLSLGCLKIFELIIWFWLS